MTAVTLHPSGTYITSFSFSRFLSSYSCLSPRNLGDHGQVLTEEPRRAEKYFASESLDNQILIYNADNLRQNRKKRFAGHSVAGYACQVGFSPDGR